MGSRRQRRSVARLPARACSSSLQRSTETTTARIQLRWVWVSSGGAFRNGVLRGAWHKPAATFVGHAAREAARQARPAELHDGATAERAGLVALEQQLAALARLRETLAALWPALSRRERGGQARIRADGDVHAVESEQAEMAARLIEAEHRLEAAVERRDTLQATAGAAIAELERRLGEVARAASANEASQRETENRVGESQRTDGAAEALSRELRQQLEAATGSRLAAVDGLRRFATTGLIAVALPELDMPNPGEEWNVTHALRLAREIEQGLSVDADEDARWQRLQRQVTDELGTLADALSRHGHNAAASFREDGIVGEVASTPQELITAAEKRVADTNHEMAERPTRTGMQLGLRWTADPDGPDGLADPRARLLRQTADAWSETDRAAVGGFLQNQIKVIRAKAPPPPGSSI